MSDIAPAKKCSMIHSWQNCDVYCYPVVRRELRSSMELGVSIFTITFSIQWGAMELLRVSQVSDRLCMSILW